MIRIIIIIVVLILVLVLGRYGIARLRDHIELSQTTLDNKLEPLLQYINTGLLDGTGEVTTFEDQPRCMNLFSEQYANMLIQFLYAGGSLTIWLNYKYYHVELRTHKIYGGLREADNFTQQRMAMDFVLFAKEKIAEHQQKVNVKIGMNSGIGEGIMQGMPTISDDANSLINEAYQDLDREQKLALTSLVYAIAGAGGVSDKQALGKEGLSSLLGLFGISFSECKSNLEDLGIDGAAAKVKDSLDDGVFTMFFTNCVSVMQPPNDARVQTFLSVMYALGYSDEDIRAKMQFLEAFSQFFGLK